MGWHKPEAQPKGAEPPRRIVTYYLVGRTIVYKVYVAIHGIGIMLIESLYHTFYYVGSGKIVVRIQRSYHIARSHSNTLVHAIVNAAVGLGYPFYPGAKLGCIGVYHL